ncbi:SsgA family sporulation/cell division regulator [Streptomyces sp. NPDC002853]
MDNATATADDDFDALLEASSLGAPRVLAALGTATPQTRRRFEHAARHPQTSGQELVPTTLNSIFDDRVHTPDRAARPASEPESEPDRPATPAQTVGSAKTVTYLRLFHQACSTAAEASSVAQPTSVLDYYRALDRSAPADPLPRIEVLPRTDLIDQCRRALEQRRPTASEEAHPWSTSMQAYLAAFLALRTHTPRSASMPLTRLRRHACILEQDIDADLGGPGQLATSFAARPGRGAPTHAWPPGAAGLGRTPRQERAALWIAATTGQRPHGTLPRLWEGLEELQGLIARLERLAHPSMQQAQRSPFTLASRLPRVTVIVSEHLASQLRLTTHTASRQPWERKQRTVPAQDGPRNLQALSQFWEAQRTLIDPLPAAYLPPLPSWLTQPQHSAPEILLQWWLLKAALADTVLGRDRRWLTDEACRAETPPAPWPAAATRSWGHALAAPCPDTPAKPPKVIWSPGHGRPHAQHTPPETGPAQPRPDRNGAREPRPEAHTQTIRMKIGALLHLKGQEGSTWPLTTRLSYRATDPYAVEAVFEPGDANVNWTFARDLLSQGLHTATGDGDVTVWPSTAPSACPQSATGEGDESDGARTYVELKPPSGTALLSLPRARVEEFLNQTFSLVPPGTEHAHTGSSLLDLETRLHQLAAHPGGCD